MPDWKAMLDAVKEECLSGRWSQGVALARADAVSGDSREGGEWTFRVRLPGDELAPTVVLYPEDAEWDCDCEGPCDPCEHVAACAIAASRAGGDAATLFEGTSRAGVLRYVLRRTDRGIVVERYLVHGDEPPRKIDESLYDLLERKDRELRFEPSQADIELEPLLTRRDAVIEFERAKRLLGLLVGAKEVRLGPDEVRASAAPLFPRASVIDGPGDGVELVIEADPAVSEVVSPGIARAGNRLHPFGAGARFGESWERLPFRRTYSRHEFGELVGTVLPELDRHISIDVKTARLPGRQARLAPWLRFEIHTEPEGTDVLAQIVYGNPPAARVDGDRLVHLDGAVPRRDEEAERRLSLRLRDELNLMVDRRVRFDAGDAARFLSALQSFDDGRPTKTRERAEQHAELYPQLCPNGEGVGELDLVFETPGGDGTPQQVSAEAVFEAWRQGLGIVPLEGGGFAHVPEGWLDRHGGLVADLLAARAENEGRTPAVALPVVAELCEAMDAPAPVEVERLRALLRGSGESEARLPAGFVGGLRKYQSDGVAWLQRLRDAGLGAILADDMGLGKTVQALCAIQGRALVVCPRSVIHNWTKEAERFRPDISVALYHGPSRKLGNEDLTLTTYATLRNDVDVLAEVEWDVVVLDEAQAIKNPDSQVARAAYRLRAGSRLSLSGTPVENRLDELWSQMHFSNRGLLGGRRDFAERYEKPILGGDAGVLSRLQARLRPFLLRRLKSEVATELPPRTDSVLYCELEESERSLYDSVRAASRDDVVRHLGEGGNVIAALEALLRLRQAACHPGLLPGRVAPSSSKVDALCEALDDAAADGHKALVFSQWTGMLDLVEPRLAAHEIEFTRLDGSTRDRGAVVDAFQNVDGPPVLLISLTAGGTGLNLTAADHVFLLDPWWNPAVEEQAADRAHRIGQDRPVMVYRLVAKDTVEERILELQERKRGIAESALGGTVDSARSLTRDDILALLED